MTAFEEKALKGITPTLIFWIIFGTASTCATVLYTYYDFKVSVRDAIEQAAVANHRLDNLEPRVTSLEFKRQLDSIRLDNFLYIKTQH